MTLPELTKALRHLRLGGMATLLELRLQQAQTERLAPLDLLSVLVADELTRRADRLLERRRKQARFRAAGKTLDTFDFDFNRKLDRALIYQLATARFIAEPADVLLLGPPGTGKSHLAQALGHAAIQQGYQVRYREAFLLLEELADATLDGTRKAYVADLTAAPLLIIDDLAMRKLPVTAAEDLFGDHHAPPRPRLHDPHLQPARRGLGQAARRHAGGHRHARSPARARLRPHLRAEELADEDPRQLAPRGPTSVNATRLARAATGRF